MLDQAEQILGYRFKDERLLAEALRHASSADDRCDSNERMEFLGDAILGFIVSEYVFAEYPRSLEGDLTKIKSAAVSRRTCALISQNLNLIPMLTLGKGMSGRADLPSSVAAGVLESVIAAVYLDGGIEAARDFVLRQFKPFIHDLAHSSHQHNFKSVLQQYAQRQTSGNPSYLLLDEKGPDHSKAFEVGVEIDGRRFGSAWANSKKEAEQMAALQALRELGLAQDQIDGSVVICELP